MVKWILMVFVGGSVPASVGHFATQDACVEAVLQVRIPELDVQGRLEGFASLNAKNVTMLCVPVERLMTEPPPAVGR